MSSTAQLDWSPTQQAILGDDPEKTLLREVSAWFEKIRLLQRQEDEQMILKDPSESDLLVHKELTQRLIDDGEYLITVLSRRRNLKSKADNVTAALELLQLNYKGWHDPMPKEESDRILKQVFGDVT
jgi:hypothetical protein